MKKAFIFALSLLSFLGISSSVLGAQVNGAQLVSPQVTSVPPSVTEQELRIAALTSESQVLKEFTQNMLSTVYFSLATVIVLLIAMLGFGWYQNFRVYERDKDAMHQALTAHVKDRLTELEHTLSKRIEGRVDSFELNTNKKFDAFDKKMAEVFALAIQRTDDFRLQLSADLLTAAHLDATPRTDFVMFIQTLRKMVDGVSSVVLHDAISRAIAVMELNPQLVIDNRIALLDLANRLPEEHQALAQRINALTA